jgi:hypothetical protein
LESHITLNSTHVKAITFFAHTTSAYIVDVWYTTIVIQM